MNSIRGTFLSIYGDRIITHSVGSYSVRYRAFNEMKIEISNIFLTIPLE